MQCLTQNTREQYLYRLSWDYMSKSPLRTATMALFLCDCILRSQICTVCVTERIRAFPLLPHVCVWFSETKHQYLSFPNPLPTSTIQTFLLKPVSRSDVNAIHCRWMLNTHTRVYFSASETLNLNLHSRKDRCRTLPVIYQAASR